VTLEINYNHKNNDEEGRIILIRILNNRIIIVREFAFVFPRLWEIHCRILTNAISIVRNSAYIFYSFRKDCQTNV
jgi:hypothetical protein